MPQEGGQMISAERLEGMIPRPLTNFEIKELPFYERAIREAGEPDLFVGEASDFAGMCNPVKTDKCLYLNAPMRDLSWFWSVARPILNEYRETKEAK
jgi:hypothetical protein